MNFIKENKLIEYTVIDMGFYSNKTPEEKRVNELTGDIHLCEEFKNELEARKIPLYKGYSIQKRLRFEVEEEKLHGKEVDERLMGLLEENSKIKTNSNYADTIENIEGATKVPTRPKEYNAPSGFLTKEFEKIDIKIPPKGKPKKTQDDLTDRELLNKIILQNEKIINQNKIIIEKLNKLGE